MKTTRLIPKFFSNFSLVIFIVIISLIFLQSCQKLEELASTLVPGPDASLGPPLEACAPGSKISDECTFEDLEYHDFFIKNRKSASPSSLDLPTPTSSLDLFTPTTCQWIGESNHFVLYREVAQSLLMNKEEASSFLNKLEIAYDGLKNIYGGGEIPDVQKTGRVVIVAVDIIDDYSANNPAFISGFFLPSDLYSDEVTQNIFSNLSNAKYYSDESGIPEEALLSIGGRSNENTIVYMDLHPSYDGVAFGLDVSKAHSLFLETAMHELSHLFTYNKRVITDKRKNHSTWIAEGIAEQAPRLLADLNLNQIEIMTQLDLTIIQEYLRNGPSILDMNSSGSLLAGYIQSNLFFNYLRHRAGSSNRQASLFSDIILQSSETVSGLDTTIHDYWAGNESFASIYGDWVISTYLSATGKNLSLIFDEDSQMLDLGDGNYPSLAYNLSYKGVGIEKKGGTDPAFGNNSLPVSYEKSMYCLDPSSFLFFDYSVKGTESVYNPYGAGMKAGLKMVLSYLIDNDNVYIYKYNFDSDIPLDTYATNSKIQLLIYNPQTEGSCISTGLLPWDTRNIASWIGEARIGWQKSPGASETTAGNGFTRPTGLAFSFKADSGGTQNFIYVADKSNQGVSRWDLDAGTFHGRMGSTDLDQCTDLSYETKAECTGAGETWQSHCEYDSVADDGFRNEPTFPINERLVNNHCRRSFNNPEGIATDSNGNIYIADSGNHRIIKRDKDGNFVAWLGSPTDDRWQCESGSTNPDCDLSGANPMGIEDPLPPGDLVAAGNGTNVEMFDVPFGVAVDETDIDPNKHYLYVVNYNTSRVVRRKLSDGTYAGFIGNGYEGWNTTETDVVGTPSAARKFFNTPSAIVIDDNYLYVADWQNNRVSRWTKVEGKNEDIFADPTKIWMGGLVDGWHNQATPIGAEKLAFNGIKGLAISGNYLYVSDWINQRIVRRSKDTGAFAGWIGGGYFEWEMTKEVTPDVYPSSSNYPPLFMTKPLSVVIGTSTETGSKHSYLYLSTVYDNRISRWNLDCVENNLTGDCSDD